MFTTPADIRSCPTRSGALRLLESAHLPASDITDSMLEHFFYVGPADAPIAMVGLELLGDRGLLRSLVVVPSARSAGRGSVLLGHAESYARTRGVRELFLLTTTADRFFERHGYGRVAREGVPDSIRSNRQFAEICPSNSTIMAKTL